MNCESTLPPDQCPICLNAFTTQQLGAPDACEHVFCLQCIQEWAKNINTCPIDRSTFRSLRVKSSLSDTGVIKSVRVVNKAAKQDGLQLDSDDEESEIDLTHCEVCGQANREDSLMLCDACDAGYHIDCLGLSRVPRGEWFCPECAAEQQRVEERRGRRRRPVASADAEVSVSTRSAVTRVIPRTQAAERVRNRIARLLASALAGVEPSDDDTDDEFESDYDELIEDDVTPSTSRGASTSRRRGGPPARRGRRRRRRRGRISIRGRRRRAPRRVRIPRSNVSSSRLTVSATNGSPEGDAKDSGCGGSYAGPRPTMSLYGSRNTILSFDDDNCSSDDEVVPSRQARRFDRPLTQSEAARILRISRANRLQNVRENKPSNCDVTDAKNGAASSSAGDDLLDSIMGNQNLLAVPAKHFTIRADGSLQAKDTAASYHERLAQARERQRQKMDSEKLKFVVQKRSDSSPMCEEPSAKREKRW